MAEEAPAENLHMAPLTCKLPHGGLIIGNSFLLKNVCAVPMLYESTFHSVCIVGNISQVLNRSYELWGQKRGQGCCW